MAIAEWAPERGRPTFSFYVTAHHCRQKPQIVEAAVDVADAVTVAGPMGPEVIRRLRESGLRAPVLFDGMGYAGKDLPAPDDWVGVQRAVGAARLLLPGALLAWDRNDDSEFIVTVQEQSRIAAGLEATMLFAIDLRWVARRTDLVVEALKSADQPAALVLIHRGDPLSERGAVQGLRRVVQRVSGVSLLRGDHGAIGALAFGAVHASVGLTTSTRHYAPPAKGSWRRPGQSARLFVRPLLDWFLASDVAGWTAAGKAIVCQRTVTCPVPRPRSRCRLAQHERARTVTCPVPRPRSRCRLAQHERSQTWRTTSSTRMTLIGRPSSSTNADLLPHGTDWPASTVLRSRRLN